MNNVRLDERTHYEATLDVRFAIEWNALNARLFRRVDALLKGLSLLLGSAAFGAWMAAAPQWSGLAGLLVALVTILDVVLAPGKKACAHDEARRQFNALAVRAPGLPLADLDAALETLRVECTAGGVDALRAVAYNRNLAAASRADQLIPLGPLERLLAVLV